MGFTTSTAAELVSIYHEDSGVPASVVALAACKGLLPYMRNLEVAARGPLGVEGGTDDDDAAMMEYANSGRIKRGVRRSFRRLFGGKDPAGRAGTGAGAGSSAAAAAEVKGRPLRSVSMIGWSARFSRFSASRSAAARGEVSSSSPWEASTTKVGGGCTGENAVRVGRFGFRQGTRRMLSKLKDNVIHRTTHLKSTHHRHENIHAEGRRRKLMVRAAGLVAMMAHVKKNRA